MKESPAAENGPAFGEFVTLVALIISLVALSIDMMLPALPEIVHDLGVERVNDSHYVISVLFAGMACGQLFFGPLSDSTGRKPAIVAGLAVFAAGSLLSLLAADFTQMLAGRFLQGLGASGPRIVSVALVRDRFEGREMARVMSFVMTIFILVPVFAPALGQGILLVAEWRMIFALFLAMSLAIGIWFWSRQPETLKAQYRLRLSLSQLLTDTLAILRIRAALGYTLVMGFVFGAFIGYLASSQQIFQVQYRLGTSFPIYFGLLASVIGLASVVNAQLVMRLGMRRLSWMALWAIAILSLLFLPPCWYFGGHPHLALLMLYLLILFFGFGILFGNLNALAMEPLGRIAGLGSAVVGSLSTLISAIFGAIVADAYDGTVLPLVSGFALLGLGALAIMTWTGDE